MTDIEQKARFLEMADKCFKMQLDGQITAEREDIAAAIQSAVEEERLENRKLFSIGMSALRREANYDRICDKVHQIDEAIRARAQAKEKP